MRVIILDHSPALERALLAAFTHHCVITAEGLQPEARFVHFNRGVDLADALTCIESEDIVITPDCIAIGSAMERAFEFEPMPIAAVIEAAKDLVDCIDLAEPKTFLEDAPLVDGRVLARNEHHANPRVFKPP